MNVHHDHLRHLSASEQSDADNNDEDFIPQVDGIGDIPDNNSHSIGNRRGIPSSTSPLNHLFVQPISHPSTLSDQHTTSNTGMLLSPLVSDPGISISYQAPYTLNKEKQISNLAKHANICNFEIERTGPHNTNIQCSTGFYEAVPKPALTTIKEGFQATISGILINCTESRAKRDQIGRNDNHVLRFKVDLNGASNAVLHLHHTQQLVQVQGSASQWFVDNFLKHAFLSEAENKKLVIDDLNKVFNAAGRNLANQSVTNNDGKYCGHCNSKFRKNTKSATCGNCSKMFHNNKNSKCLLVHTCLGNNSTPVQPSASGTTVSSSPPTYSSTGSRVSVTFVPATTHSEVPISTANTQAGQLSTQPPPRRSPGPSGTLRHASSSVISKPATSDTGTTPSLLSSNTTTHLCDLVLNQPTSNDSQPSGTHHHHTVGPVTVPVSASPATSSLPSTIQSNISSLNPAALPYQANTSTTQKRKNPNSNQTNSVHEAEIAILKQELVIARTKMLQIEADNKDLTRKNAVLAETLKMYESEQNKTLRRKYFGEQVNPATSTDTITSTPSPATGPIPAYSGPSQHTLDRLINYLLDTVQGLTSPSCPTRNVTPLRETHLSDASAHPTSFPDKPRTSGQPCSSSPAPISPATPASHTAEPRLSSPPRQSTVATASPVNNKASTAINDDPSGMTIDELIDENQDLNFLVQTTQ